MPMLSTFNANRQQRKKRSQQLKRLMRRELIKEMVKLQNVKKKKKVCVSAGKDVLRLRSQVTPDSGISASSTKVLQPMPKYLQDMLVTAADNRNNSKERYRPKMNPVSLAVLQTMIDMRHNKGQKRAAAADDDENDDGVHGFSNENMRRPAFKKCRRQLCEQPFKGEPLLTDLYV